MEKLKKKDHIFNLLKQSLLFLYMLFTSLSALKTGNLNSFAINDFPDPILPIIPILIIKD